MVQMETAKASRRSPRIITDSEDEQEARKPPPYPPMGTKADAIPEEEHKGHQEAYQHTYPIHTSVKASALSKEAPPGNYSGFLRLGMLVLAASNLRLIIENYQKYGLLIRVPTAYLTYTDDYYYFLLAWLCVPVSIVTSFTVEKVMAQLALGHKKALRDAKGLQTHQYDICNTLAAVVHFVHLTFLILFPSMVVYRYIYNPLFGIVMLMTVVILFLKLTSYALVNRDLRDCYLKSKSVTSYTIAYPTNIAVRNLLYFWWAPTLCYQPSYPSTKSFNRMFFLKRVGECIICLVAMFILAEQYAKPTLENSLQALDQLDLVRVAERVLKLSTISVVIWLLMFYAMFHSSLNALSEILRFGDRTFYLAWWNSGNVATYWRLWNRPVYLWFKRHVYLPLVSRGVPPKVASFGVFLISAILHEYLVGVPTHAITGFAFFGMLGQIPLIALTAPLEKWRGKGTGLGNTIFWITFCVVGQPTIALLYYYQWSVRYRSQPQ
ncbi:hypothetical protein BZG36_02908 [Bifiguratus adelaidae]|uniref:O-acyltransferase n=1 Tax=Bifiguratus adelaidae TaxID=1938954 RepID=A0A261Y1E5_9FUNG|nr:hypothetical protein BZG36_02908 [Bifiguratus adelaidae]